MCVKILKAKNLAPDGHGLNDLCCFVSDPGRSQRRPIEVDCTLSVRHCLGSGKHNVLGDSLRASVVDLAGVGHSVRLSRGQLLLFRVTSGINCGSHGYEWRRPLARI